MQVPLGHWITEFAVLTPKTDYTLPNPTKNDPLF